MTRNRRARRSRRMATTPLSATYRQPAPNDRRCIIVQLKPGTESDAYAQAPKAFATASAVIDDDASCLYSCRSDQGLGISK
jgi:hypothetical protein